MSGQISAQAVTELAQSMLPVADPTPGPFVDNLELLVASINEEGQFSEQGAAACTGMLALAQRKRIEVSHWCEIEPGIVQQPVERPGFLTGLPRSGTTYFQYLFDREPSLRMMRTWEGDSPCPRPPQPIPHRRLSARRNVPSGTVSAANATAVPRTASICPTPPDRRNA